MFWSLSWTWPEAPGTESWEVAGSFSPHTNEMCKPHRVLVGYWDWNRLENLELCHLCLWLRESRNTCIIYTAVAAVLCNGIAFGKKHACPFFFSFFPLCQSRVLHMAMVTELFPALALLKAGFHIAVLPCLFRTLWWSSTGEVPKHIQKFYLALLLRRMELCFHRDQSLCVSRKLFLGAAV